MPTRNQLIATGVAVGVVGGLVGYAAWFDYKRRNDEGFRKKLRKEHKRVYASAAKEAKLNKEKTTQLLRASLITISAEPLPQSPEEKEAYFMEQVAMGEGLAQAGPLQEVPAALCFYRALRVYPSPVELIMIYQKTVPGPIFNLLMELTSLDVSKDIASSAASRPAAAGKAPSAADVDEEVPATAESSPSATGGGESSMGSGSGGEWETLTDEGKAARAAQA